MNIEDIKKRLDAYNEFKELAAQNKADFENIHNAQNMFNVNSARDMAYLLSTIEQQNDILQSLAYTVLADFTHMSEYHINSTVVELAKKAEKLCEMDIKSRATDEVINEHWNLEG